MAILPRRDFLKTGAATLAGSQFLFAPSETSWATTPAVKKLPVTALCTAYYPVSHADVIVTKILEGYKHDGGAGPGLKLESIYVEQDHPSDISKDLAKKHGVRLCKSIDEAITLGTDRVQVAGVMSIAEHGDYPFTPDTQQKMYPRRRFFDETVATFRRCGQSVPYFNDKHLSYRWEDAIAMVQIAREMKFPLLAGSSLPLTWRFPAVELPRDCEIESVLSIGYGPLEDYGFHALETNQCMIERRKGGETGVVSVRAAIGADIRATEAAGDWSSELFAAARQVTPGMPNDTANWKPTEVEYDNYRLQPAAYLFEHRDGLKSAVIMAAGLAGGFSFAAKLKGQEKPIASWFKLQDWMPFGHFAYLVNAFEQTIRAGHAVYPVERTLLTTGILDRCMHSMAQGGSRLATPELAISYQAVDWTYANHPNAPFHLSDE